MLFVFLIIAQPDSESKNTDYTLPEFADKVGTLIGI
jgi:hypothetical protein